MDAFFQILQTMPQLPEGNKNLPPPPANTTKGGMLHALHIDSLYARGESFEVAVISVLCSSGFSQLFSEGKC